MRLNIWPIILSIAALLGYSLSVRLLWRNGGDHRENRCLAGLLLVISLILTQYVAASAPLYNIIPHLIAATMPLWFLLLPLFYLHFRVLFLNSPGSGLTLTLHILPFVLSLLLLVPFYLLPASQKQHMLYDGSSDFYSLQTYLLVLLMLQCLCYFPAVIRMLNKREEQALASGIQTTHIKRMRWIFTSFCLFMLFDCLSYLLFTKALGLGEVQYAFILTLFLCLIFISRVRPDLSNAEARSESSMLSDTD